MSDGRILQIFRDGRRFTAQTKLQLPRAAAGNLITLAKAAEIVREDAEFSDLKNFVMREIIGLDKTNISEQINAAFEFSRDQIVYEQEKDGFETIADLWSCLYALNPRSAQGDCVIKCVALATCLSYLKLKPYFVAIKQILNADYFNHVYLGVMENGTELSFDPTPKEFRAGQKTNFYQRLNYPIFK